MCISRPRGLEHDPEQRSPDFQERGYFFSKILSRLLFSENWQLLQISLIHPRIRGSLIKALGAFYSHCSPRSRSTQTSNICLAWVRTGHGTGNEMALGA